MKMKKSIVTIVALSLVATALLSSCNTSAKKVEKAEQELKEAEAKLETANAEYQADIENFRADRALQIEANEKRIAELKQSIATQKKDAKAAYQKKIDELEQMNNEMKVKMNDYKANGIENWENFKSEFSRDMDELGKSINDFTVNNTKS